MLIPDLLDQKKLVENIKQEKEQPLYPNTELWAGGHEPTPYYPNTELHADTPLEYGGRVRMGINQFMQPASQYVNEATNILPNLIITALKKMGLPVSGDPQKDFGTFLVYALTPNSPVEYYQTAKALLPYFSEAKQNLTAKPAYAEEVDTPEGKRMRLYHGTIYDFADEEISPNARKSANYGIYMSPEENVAKAYARVPFHGDTGVKKYLLSQGAKVLDVSDGEEFWNWMIKNGVLGKEEIEDPTLYEKVTGGFLWEYDATNKTRYANDAVRTAESMGYDAVIIPDWLPVDGIDEFSKTSAYVVMNPKVLEPGASDEALQARWEQYRRELEAKKQEEVETPVLAFHGTTKAFDTFEVEKYDQNDIVLDRFIGSHFAVDPRLANNMTMDSTRTNILEGANVHAVNLHIKKPYVLPQHLPGYKGIASDQTAFNIDIARRVFPKRKDLFVEYLAKQRNMPKEEVSKIYDKIKAGKRITEKDSPLFYPTPDYDDQFAGLADNYSILGFDNDWKMEMVKEYRKQLAEEGYDAIQYQNTSPMETKNVKNKTCYVVFDNSLIKNAYSEQDYGKQVDSTNIYSAEE